MNLILPIYIWPIPRLLNKETERVRTYVRSQQFKLPYYTEWPEALPEVVSKLDTQVALDGTAFFWGPALSMMFKIRMPDQGRAAEISDQLTDVQLAEITFINGKVTLDATQFL